MPNNQPPAKTRIDERANKALADLKKVTDAHPELDLITISRPNRSLIRF